MYTAIAEAGCQEQTCIVLRLLSSKLVSLKQTVICAGIRAGWPARPRQNIYDRTAQDKVFRGSGKLTVTKHWKGLSALHEAPRSVHTGSLLLEMPLQTSWQRKK